MKKEIKIKIIGIQRDMDGEENKIELLIEGKFYRKENVDYIMYDESEISGLENSKTRLKLESRKVHMKRFGQSSSDMVFSEEEDHRLDYRTPYGIFKMQINTDSLHVDIKEELSGSVIDLSYSLTMLDNDMTTANKLRIEIV